MNQHQHTPPDPRPGLAVAIDLVGSIVAEVDADQLSFRTPCDAFDVSQLAAHLLGVMERIRMVGQRDTDWPDLVPDNYQHDTYQADWKRLSGEIQDVWSDDALMDEVLTLPFAQLPGAAAVGLYLGEVLVHGWDLATACGIEVAWNQDLAEATLVGMQMGLPAEGRDDPEIPFAPVVEVGDDATAMERVVAWVGRDPSLAPGPLEPEA